MAKGKGKKKKSKAELEAERIAAEEEAKRLEEERIRLEEEERKRREEEEATLKAEEEERLGLEDARLKEEVEETASFLSNRSTQLILEERRRREAAEWERYLLCIPRPNPLHEPEMSTWSQQQVGMKDDDLPGTLEGCQDNVMVAEEAEDLILQLQEQGQHEAVDKLSGYVGKLRGLTARRLDRVSAHLLQHTDDVLDEKSVVTGQLGSFKYGLWVNVAKNPRLKMIEMPELGVVAELPKSLALASIAIRFTHLSYDDLSAGAQAQDMALGGVFAADLLALPPPSKAVKGWTLRTISALSNNVQKLPYPIPPAGADHAAPTPGTQIQPPPMGLTYPLPEHVILPEGEDPRVGWWDAENSRWCEDGVNDVRFDPDTRMISFQTVKLTHLALIQSRVRLLPYKAWSLRPSGVGQSCAVLSLVCANLPEPMEIEIGRGTVKYLAPAYPQLEGAGVLGVDMRARLLLRKLSACGLHLLPTDRDAKFAQTTPKSREVLDVVYTDLAMLADYFLISSSRWNVHAGAGNCLYRVKEVTDHARTRQVDVEKVFFKDKPEYNVRTLLRQAKGCAVVPLKDADEELSPEVVSGSPQHNEFHSSVLTALKANRGPPPLVGRAKAAAEAGEPPAASPPPRTPREEGEEGAAEEGEEEEAVPPPPPPPPASEETLGHVQGSDAIFTETVKYLLAALGVFSFG